MSPGPEERAKGMGLIGAAFGLGFVLGPALGGFLGAWGGNLAIGLFAAGLAALNLVFTFAFLRRVSHAGERGPSAATARSMKGAALALRLPVVGLCLLLILVFTTAFSQMEGTFSVYLLSRFLSSGPVPLEGGLFFLSAQASPEALAQASLRTGGLFALVGVVSAAIQGGLLPRLLPPERRSTQGYRPVREGWLLVTGFAVTGVAWPCCRWRPGTGGSSPSWGCWRWARPSPTPPCPPWFPCRPLPSGWALCWVAIRPSARWGASSARRWEDGSSRASGRRRPMGRRQR